LVQRPVAAAWYCSNTLAGIRPRALTATPWSLAHLRTWPPPGRRPRRPACGAAARLAGVLNERRELLAEGTGVLGAQVDLVVGAVESEPHSLFRRAAIQVVFQRYSDLLSHLSLQCRRTGFAAPLAAMIPHTIRNSADHTPVLGPNRRAAPEDTAEQRRPGPGNADLKAGAAVRARATRARYACPSLAMPNRLSQCRIGILRFDWRIRRGHSVSGSSVADGQSPCRSATMHP